MDNVPYEFVHKVFVNSGYTDTVYKKFQSLESPLWKAVAAEYRKKYQIVHFYIRPETTGFFYGIYSGQHYDGCEHDSIPIRLTFDELLQLDLRFTCMTNFCTEMTRFFFRDIVFDDLNVVGDNLPKMIEFLSSFTLDSVNINLDVDRCHPIYREQLLAQLTKFGLPTKSLSIAYAPGMDQFLKNQMKSDALTYFELLNAPVSLKPDIEAYVCRPLFVHLKCEDLACFDIKAFKRIIAYWKSMNKPWNSARFSVRTRKDLSPYFARWMKPFLSNENAVFDDESWKYYETHGNYVVLVNCDDEMCDMKFRKKTRQMKF